MSNVAQTLSGRAQLHRLEPPLVAASDLPVAPCLAGYARGWVIPTCEWCGGGRAGVPRVWPLTAVSVCSLCPGQQVAAAHLCRARAGGQDLRLLAVPTEVLLPDRAAGECPRLLHTPPGALQGTVGTEGLRGKPGLWGLVLSLTPTQKATGAWCGASGCPRGGWCGGGLVASVDQHSQTSRPRAAGPSEESEGSRWWCFPSRGSRFSTDLR